MEEKILKGKTKGSRVAGRQSSQPKGGKIEISSARSRLVGLTLLLREERVERKPETLASFRALLRQQKKKTNINSVSSTSNGR